MNHCEPNYRHYTLARTARTCAFCAVITALFGTIVFPFIFGGLSIIFAVLSKGNTVAYQLNAKIAIIVSCFALLGNTAYTGIACYNIFFNETYREELNKTFEQMYGMSMDEYISEYIQLPLETDES